jgi:spore maturation protein CgeB
MFIVPEEINDLPAIGAVEGMACGCAYIGKIDPMYTDLGFIPNVHYIGYDGSLKDLIIKISYFQKHAKQLEKIASAGYKFVTAKYNGPFVAQNFIKDINSYSKDRSKVICTFTKSS